MKKILYIFLLSGLLSSCDDLLDVEPETLLSFDNYFKTEFLSGKDSDRSATYKALERKKKLFG